MALTRNLNRLESPLQTIGEPNGRRSFSALSQRKLNTLGVPIAYVDHGQRYRFANKAFLDWLGKTEAELIGREVIEVLGRDFYQLYHAYLDAALAGERTSYERRIGAPGRPLLWARVDYYPDRGPQGEVRGLLVTYTDINSQKRLELEAGQREHQLRLVTDSVGVPILYFDRLLKLRFVNRPYGDWIGVPPEELLGHALKDILAPDAMDEMLGHIQSAFSGATVSYERREACAGGESRWIRMTLFPDRQIGGRVGGAFAVMNDIEEDIRIRDALKSQEAQMRLFADNIPGPVAYLDRSLNYTFVNQAFANVVCKPQDAIYGKTPFQIMSADVAAFIRPILKRAQAGEHVEYERLGVTARGKRRWLHGRVAPDLDGAGNVRGLYCTEYDIHDLKLTEQALAAREAQLRLFTDNIPEPVVYMDADRRYAFINESFLLLTGLARDAVIGKTATEVLGHDASSALAPFMDRAFAGEPVTYEHPMVDASGRGRCLRERIVPDLKFDGTIKGLYVVGHDITDLKRAQDALAAREGQLRAIMDGVPAPVAYIDRDERCQYVNHAFLRYFGLKVEEVGEVHLCDVVGAGIYESAQARLTRAMEGKSAAFDRLVPGANGARRWMTIRVVPDIAPSGDVHGVFVMMNDIHSLKETQEALRASESDLRLIMDNVPARVSYIDRDYRYRFLNRHNEEWLAKDGKELTGRHMAEVLGDARAAQLAPFLYRVMLGEVVSTEKLLAQPDGEDRWEAVHYAPNRDGDGNVVGIYAVHTDIHDEKRRADELKRVNWMLSSHINNTPLAVLEWDREFRLVRWPAKAEDIFGWSPEQVLGTPLASSPLMDDDERRGFRDLVARLMSGEEAGAKVQTRNRRSDGSTIWCEWYHSVLMGEDGCIDSVLSFVQDVSPRIQADERLQYLATRDALTGLPNRLLLHERLTQSIAKAKRAEWRVGALFIDLDRFKNVNDTFGHRIGDELLKRVTSALGGALRETDLLARLGGDEFMIVVDHVEEPSVLGRIAQKLLDAIAQPFEIEEHDIYVTSSIGIAVYPDDSNDPEELLKHADAAMYRAKELGRNTYQFFDADLAQHRLHQHALETALRAAFRDGALRLHYQPVVRIEDRKIVGAEALLRWHDAGHGNVPPKVFIPLAEESGLIHALGDWVLKSAAEQCVAWRRAGLSLTIAVNLSARQFYRDDLAQRICDVVKGVGCLPSWIALEVTETSLLHDLDAIRTALQKLRNEGFTVAIDDFGTGYSSLTHLKHFPIDTLKIDISFIADLETDPGDAAITAAIIGLARGLGLRVCAEGVGTREQLEFLAQHGCDFFQGFWASEPVPADRFAELVHKELA